MRNTVSGYVAHVVEAASVLCLVPFLLGQLGAGRYGLWSLLVAVVAFYAILDMGLGVSVSKYVADARGRADALRERGVVCTLFWIYVAQMLLLLLATAVLAECLGPLFHLNEEDASIARGTLWILGGGQALAVPLSMFRGVLMGNQRLWVADAYRAACHLAYLAAALVCITRWPSLTTLAALTTGRVIVQGVLTAIHALSAFQNISLRPRFFDGRLIGEIVGFSASYALITIATLCTARVDAFIINGYSTLEMVAVYAVAMRVAVHAQQLCSQISRALTPAVAELHAAGRSDRLRDLALEGTKISVAVSTPLLLACGLMADPLIVAWVGEDMRPTVPVLRLLLLWTFSSVVHGQAAAHLGMRGRQNYLSWVLVLIQVANVAVSLLFVRQWGAVGVALATVIAIVPLHVVFLQGGMARLSGIPRLSFYSQTVRPALVPSLALALTIELYQRAFGIEGLVEVATVGLLSTIAFAAAYVAFGLTSAQRSTLFRWARARIPGTRRQRPPAEPSPSKPTPSIPAPSMRP